SPHSLVSVAHSLHVAPGHSGSGGGSLSTQGLPPAPVPPLPPAPPVPLGVQRPQLRSQYCANQALPHSSVSVAQFLHVAPGQFGSGGGSTSTQGFSTPPVPPLPPDAPPTPPLPPLVSAPPLPAPPLA